MQNLNFPNYHFKYKKVKDKTYIFDIVRKKFYLLTPEEWVRQHILHYLIFTKKYSKNLIAVEKKIEINQTFRRFDVVVFNHNMQAYILIECKSPDVKISQSTFDQINQYNWLIKAPYLFLTNGMKHYICLVDFNKNNYQFIKELPENLYL